MEVISINSDSRHFDYLSSPEASEAAAKDGSTLVWPFGACEQHGPHLPLVTDALFAEEILTEVLDQMPKETPIWMLPVQKIGFSPEHLGFPGTLSISADLMLQLVSEIGRQLADLGIKRLVLFNAHGGQIGLLQAVARQLRAECPSMAVLPCFLWSGIESLKDLIPHREVEEGLHAALAETSLMLSIKPELVGIQRPFDGDENFPKNNISIPEGWSLEGAAPCAWLTKDLSITGVIGDSRGANPDLGDRLKNALVEHWTSLFINLMNSNWPSLGA
ncbi:creatininase family protein [Prochlorococcus marinus]|uniref:creatininase family protein n=1 Tax=Prochlorococcus marinus TaxID=1219 RepID=UPI00117EB6FF|nr:creatininase family protein [Prochlorococcus marinus]